jgi:hypothetical protein
MTKQNVIAASLAADAQALDTVVALLDEACAAGRTMTGKAREAASKAVSGNFLDDTPVVRIGKILGLYMPHLIEKAVKDVFSSAVSVLCNDKPVRIAASEVGQKAPTADYPEGQVTLKAPEVLSPVADKGEVLPEGKIVKELSAEEAVAQLSSDLLKKVATATREAMGTSGQGKGGGRPIKPENKRAPFFDELAAVLKDSALRTQCLTFVELAADTDATLKNSIIAMAKRLGEGRPKAGKNQAATPSLATQAGA